MPREAETTMVVLEFRSAIRDASWQCGWDGEYAWCRDCEGEPQRGRYVAHLQRCRSLGATDDGRGIGQRVLAHAEAQRCYLVTLREAAVLGRQDDSLILWLHSAGEGCSPRGLAVELQAVMADLERADMTAEDRRIYIGRPTGGIGF